MKLRKFAIAALALSVSAAYAGGTYKSAASDEMKLQSSTSSQHAATQLPGAPAGYSDKSGAAEVSGPKDRTEAQPVIESASSDAALAGAPAGYADKPSGESKKDMPQDTQQAQSTMSDSTIVASSSVPASNAPAGYADTSPSLQSGPQDTEKAQSK